MQIARILWVKNTFLFDKYDREHSFVRLCTRLLQRHSDKTAKNINTCISWKDSSIPANMLKNTLILISMSQAIFWFDKTAHVTGETLWCHLFRSMCLALTARCYYLVLRLHWELTAHLLKHDKTRLAQVRVWSCSIYNGQHVITNVAGCVCIDYACSRLKLSLHFILACVC